MQNEEIPQINRQVINQSDSSAQYSTSFKKAQVLPALVAVFGFLALIFMVSTIALAVNMSQSGQSTQEESTISFSETADVLRFSTENIENLIDDASYKYGSVVKDVDGHQVVSASINNDGEGVVFEVNWEFVSRYYNLDSTRVDQESFKIATSKPVADITIGRATNENNDDVLLLLLTDGTIHYMPIRQSLGQYSFKIVGMIEDIDNIVKFYHVNEVANGESFNTVMVQRDDGSIVDLRSRLLQVVGKDTK